VINRLIIILTSSFISICAQSSSQLPVEYSNDYQLSSERYFSNSDGQIKMKVNLWGHVERPGSHFVYDGIDLASLISIVGGPKTGAHLKKVRLYREVPDTDGSIVYEINFNDFIKSGNRENFIKIKPNDTIIIPQKLSNIFITQIGTINTLFSLIMIILQIQAS
tara:strand:+ start:99 stop:590 length:492 start_codon:yes stop_codon:yes gene_type:complete